jgi:alkanesulfonate monooxygenase SsuD/methylene tetrahydromethanopterin reductase-like flavin-dependent oxidoreductase (luciferase family)
MTWDQIMADRVAVGTPERVAERLREIKQTLDLSGIVAEFNAGEIIPQEEVANSMRLFCEEVAPELR